MKPNMFITGHGKAQNDWDLLLSQHDDPTALSYFNNAGITDNTERAAANAFFTGVKAYPNIWNAIKDGIGYLVSPTSYGAALYNSFNSNFNLSSGVAPAYSATIGLAFDGVTHYLKSGFQFSAHVTTQHQYSTLFINRLSGIGVSGDIWSAFNASSQQYSITPNGVTNLVALTDNNSTAVLTGVNGNSQGEFIFNCYADGTREVIRNGVTKASTSTPGAGTLPSVEAYLGARNNAGSPSRFYASRIISFIQTTKPLTKAESQILMALLVTYNANVISGGR